MRRSGVVVLTCLYATAVLSAGTTRADPDDEHAWVRLVHEYRAAVKAHDVDAVRRLQTPDARVWFDERKGEGRPLSAGGKGPWAEWDRYFRARSTASDPIVVSEGVRITNLETNDWYRLVDRTPVPYYIFYFVKDGRISGKLIQSMEGAERPPDRLSDFEAWAEREYPGLLEELMPGGNIDPRLEKAKLWKQKLLEWRRDAGLPAVLDQ